MVMLSPKALRFARQATRAAILRDAYDVPKALSDRLHALEEVPAKPSRYVEVPEDIGRLFLSILEKHLESAGTEQDDPNDIMFMAAVAESLRRELLSPV